MYVRVLNFMCRQETQEEQIQDVYRQMVNEAQGFDGFLGSTLLMRDNACHGMAMMYWRDEHAAANAGPYMVHILGEYVHDLLDTPPEVVGYHVIENGILQDQAN